MVRSTLLEQSDKAEQSSSESSGVGMHWATFAHWATLDGRTGTKDASRPNMAHSQRVYHGTEQHIRTLDVSLLVRQASPVKA